ncbi:hypothetical protein [Streptomyces vastus]|uniref:hypothetical protein n=1 Tax=Streptomyces vastus TaxID=285451 RepID=UPI0031DACFBF
MVTTTTILLCAVSVNMASTTARAPMENPLVRVVETVNVPTPAPAQDAPSPDEPA